MIRDRAVYSCSRHCGGELINIDGYTAPTALETFLGIGEGEKGVHGPLFLQYKPDPCVDSWVHDNVLWLKTAFFG